VSSVASTGSFATPELAFLAAATQWPRTPAVHARTVDLAERVTDWDLVMRLTETHRVVGLAADAVAVLNPQLLPPEDREALLAESRDQAMDDLRHAHETVRLVRAFETAGIAVVVLKGAAIAREIFGRFGLRSSIDIDLLVAPADVIDASRILSTLSLSRTEPAADASAAEMRDRLARHKDFVFWNATNGLTVELHWRLFQNATILPVIGPAMAVSVELFPGEAVPVLPLAWTALYLCVHGGEHGWARLKWLADIGALIHAGQIDADTIYAAACAHKVRRMVGPGLVLAHRIYDTPLPIALARHLRRDWRMRRLVDVAWTCLTGEEDGRELEERAFATTRKNLSHYLVSTDPRHLWREFWFDIHDKPQVADSHRRMARLIERAWGLMRGSAGKTRRQPEGETMNTTAVVR
jgi:hypothetical protein